MKQIRKQNTLLKSALIFCLLATVLLLTGCGGSASQSASSAPADAKWPAMESLTALEADDLTSASVTLNLEGGAFSQDVNDAAILEDIYLRLSNVQIKESTTKGVEDNGLQIILSTDNTNLTFNFEGDVLVLEDGSRYEVEKLGSLRTYLSKLVEGKTTAANTESSASADSAPAAAPAPSNNSGASANEVSGASNVSSANSAPKASNAPSTGSASYDVSVGFEKNQWDDIEILYFNDFLVTMPDNEKWSFEMDGNAVTFYLFSAQQEGYGGKLVTIRGYDMNDNSYENLPSYQVAGVASNANVRLIAIYPTDVQFNGSDATQKADYEDLYTYLRKIGAGAVNSPLQTSDSNPAS